MADAITRCERELLDLCLEIGGIAESNGVYTHGLARRLAESGKPIGEITLGDLVAEARAHGEAFNRVHRTTAVATQSNDNCIREPAFDA